MRRHQRKWIRVGHRRVSLDDVEFFQVSLLGWWQRTRRIFPWRQRRASLYQQIVSEILLQRTRAETVAAFWPTFIKRYPSWERLARSTIAEIRLELQPLGLSRQRAPRLHSLAKLMAARRGRFPNDRVEIEALPAVGQYVANAILLFASEERQPLLDTNMARVLERFFGARKLVDIRYDPFLQEVSRIVVNSNQCANLNWAILDLAAAICRPRHPCVLRCPLKERCKYARQIIVRPRRYMIDSAD